MKSQGAFLYWEEVKLNDSQSLHEFCETGMALSETGCRLTCMRSQTNLGRWHREHAKVWLDNLSGFYLKTHVSHSDKHFQMD